MQYKIIVDKQSRLNPTADKKEYVIDIEELRFKGDIYDSLIITADEDYVLRRLKLTEYYVLEELAEPVKEPLENINIELFEGDNYIYLVDMTGNKFYAEYLIKNDFNDTYATRKEMHSAIDLTAQNINLSVNQKLQNYSTKEEMNSAIDVKANEINNKVEKKVDEETITGAYLILKINGDTSGAKINADIIDLSANDILNLLAGNTINLTSANIVINSNNFKVDKNGNIEANNSILKNLKIINGEITLSSDGNKVIRVIKDGDTNKMVYITHNIVGMNNGSDHVEVGVQGYPSIDVYRDGSTGSYITHEGISTPKLTQTSLAESKKNFEKMSDNALEILKNIDIYKYNLKIEQDTDKKHIGFVIGDKYNYSKEVTSLDNTGVDNYSFTSLCCKAIQELSQQVEELQNKLKEKEG